MNKKLTVKYKCLDCKKEADYECSDGVVMRCPHCKSRKMLPDNPIRLMALTCFDASHENESFEDITYRLWAKTLKESEVNELLVECIHCLLIKYKRNLIKEWQVGNPPPLKDAVLKKELKKKIRAWHSWDKKHKEFMAYHGTPIK